MKIHNITFVLIYKLDCLHNVIGYPTTLPSINIPTSTSRSVACLNTSYWWPPSKTIVKPTTLTEPVPVQCNEYLILDDYTRNMRCGEPDHYPWTYCDLNDLYNTSPDWKNGDNWYRMLPPAGTMIPEQPSRPFYCGTAWSGWMQDSHPQEAGQTKDGRVCFSGNYGNGDDCHWSVQVKVTNCQNFYVYFLPEASDSYYARYCATHH